MKRFTKHEAGTMLALNAVDNMMYSVSDNGGCYSYHDIDTLSYALRFVYQGSTIYTGLGHAILAVWGEMDDEHECVAADDKEARANLVSEIVRLRTVVDAQKKSKVRS